MKNFNLTQMLQGCSKRNGMTVSASNPDGEPTVNRQSRLMSLSGKNAEKEALSSTCLRSASVPLSFRSRYLRYAAMIFCVLAMSIGHAWGSSAIMDFASSSTTGPSTINKQGNFYTINGISISTGSTKSIDASSGNTVNGISWTGRNGNKSTYYIMMSGDGAISKFVFYFYVSNKDATATFTLQDGTTASATLAKGSVGAKDAADSIVVTGSFSQGTIYKLVMSNNEKLYGARVEYGSASSARTYDGTEKLYFLRDAWSWWNNDSPKFFAYFYNNTTSTNAWSEAASWQVQTTSENKDVWAYTVPEGTWEGVILTRHPSGTTTPTFDNKTNQSNDITIDANKNLITDWKVNDQDNSAHNNTWSNITLDDMTVYFDNRNYSTWTTAYVRMGHSTYNSAWGPMTKVAGTKYLYSQETDQWDYHTEFAIANAAGWTNDKNIYQPYENQWTGTGNDYQMDKQTTYQKYGVARDVYLCPTSTSTLERDCQYYNVNGGTSTNTFEDESTGVSLPQYTVTATGTNCTVTMVQYTADDFSTSSALSSGSSVNPTRYVGVTVSPSTGYEFGSVSLTEDAFEQHTAAAAGVTGKYAILADCEINASCTPITYSITYKDGGDVAFTGYHVGNQPTNHTYGTATALKKAVKAGYVFGGWYTNSTCTTSAGESLGATAYTANITLYAKWTAISMVDLVSGTFYGASAMVPAGVTVGSEQYYPGVSSDQRFNLLGVGTSNDDSGNTSPMSSKTISSQSLTNASAVTECMYFKGAANVTSYVPSSRAVQFKIPAAGQLEVWANNNIYLSNGSSETEVTAKNYSVITVAAGTYYLYAKNSSRTLWGIRYKKTHSVSAVTSTGTTTYGTVSAAKTTLAEDSTTTITAVPATGYQVTNWAVSGTSASISPSGSGNSNTTTLTMGTADATVTVTFGLINYSVTYSSPSNGDYTIKVGDGSAGSATKTANYGNTITLAATPDDGYHFSSWTITNTSTSADVTASVSLSDATDKDATFTMPAYGVTVTATFEADCTDPSASLSNESYTIGGSSVDLRTLWSSSNTTDDVTFSVTSGTGTIAADGYTFSSSTAGSVTITASQTSTGDYCDAEETATITVSNPTYNVSYKTTGSDSGSAPSDATDYEEGDKAVVKDNTGLVKTGKVFCGWNTASTLDGTFYSPTDTIIMPDADVDLYPVFGDTIQWTLTLTASAETLTIGRARSSSANIISVGDLIWTGVAYKSSKTGSTTYSCGMTSYSDKAAAAGNHVSGHFTVASGYSFTPLRVSLATTAISNAKNMSVMMGSDTVVWRQPASSSATPTRHEYSFSSPSSYTGKDSLKFVAYGETSGFRIGSPIVVYGIVKKECDPITATATAGTASVTGKTTASLPYTLSNTTNVASVTVKVYEGSTLRQTYAGQTATTSGTCSATGLSAGTTYTYTVTPIASTGYCDGDESSKSSSFTTQYGVTYAAGVTLTSGSAPSDANGYTSGATVTVLGNTGSMVYGSEDFLGWTDGTTFYVAGNTFSITANTTLTAVWSGSCSGSTTLFSLTVNQTGNDLYVARNGGSLALTTSNAFSALSGGTVAVVNNNTNSGGPDKMVGIDNSERHIRFTSTGNQYMSIALSTITLAQGDVIAFTSNGSAQFYITKTTTYSNSIETTSNSYTVPESSPLIGESTIYLWPKSTSAKIYTFTITRGSGSSCYDVTFSDGSTAPTAHVTWPDNIEGVPTGKKIVAPTAPTAIGYTFGGWYKEAACSNSFSFSGTITKDTTLYAKWTKDDFMFTGATDSNWSTTTNWVGNALPDIDDDVYITAAMTVDVDDAQAKSVTLMKDGDNAGSLTIDAGNALVIAGTLKKTTDGSTLVATAAADVTINSTRDDGTGALIIGGETGSNAATMNFETKAKLVGGSTVNQFIGSPFSNTAPYVDYGQQLYKFCPQQNGDRGWWQSHESETAMTPFWGYNVLCPETSFLDLNWTGKLNPSESKTITDFYYNGSSETDNMFANSWTAPIHVGEIEDADLTNVSKTLYMFNAGTPAQEAGHSGADATNSNDDPGTYISIPIHSATYAGIGVIPSMQAFYVEATGSSASITLDYNKLVYTPALTSVGIVPNRAPRHSAEVVEPEVIKLRVQSETGWAANTYVMGRADFAEGYEDGWDGAYIEGESATPKLYTPSIDGNMFINCLPQIEGTVVGFRKGSSDNNYIFSFDYDGDEVWYLNDQKAQKSTQIMNGQTYAFESEAGDNAARFVISATPINKIATGCESVGAEAAKVRKVIIDDKVYIIRGGQVFDVLGKTIKK